MWPVHARLKKESVTSSKVNISDHRGDKIADSDGIEGGEIQASIHVVFCWNRALVTMRSMTALSLNMNPYVQSTCVYILDIV
jgi:hypothetical protein